MRERKQLGPAIYLHILSDICGITRIMCYCIIGIYSTLTFCLLYARSSTILTAKVVSL
jgi:hypothetical protein